MVERLLQMQPQAMYLTHFAARRRGAAAGRPSLRLLQRMVEIGLARRAEQRHARLREGLPAMYLQSLREHGCTLADDECAALLEVDVELNPRAWPCGWIANELR